MAIQASFETATPDNSTRDASSGGQLDDNRETSEIDSGMSLLESLTIVPDSEPSANYLQAVGQSSRNTRLEESYFPPLPGASSNSSQLATHNSEGPGRNTSNNRQLSTHNSEGSGRNTSNSRQLATHNSEVSGRNTSNSSQLASHYSEGVGRNTMAARLRSRNKGTVAVLNSAQSRSLGNHGLGSSGSSTVASAFPALVSSSSINTPQSRQLINDGQSLSSSSNSSQARAATDYGLVVPSSSSSSWNSSSIGRFPHSVSSSSSSSQARPATGHGRVVPSSAGASWNSSGSDRFPHSVSAPNLVERESLNSSKTYMVPASASESQMPHSSSQSLPNADVHTANKSLVERIRAGLGYDEDKYTAFKEISSEYRQDLIDTGEYLAYVEQFGLSHLVLELAQLCPDAQKQRALINYYNARMQKNVTQENGASNTASSKESKGSRKGKGKHVDGADNGTKESLADSVIDTVRKLQANYKPSEEVEVLSKDGYRAGKGKSTASLVADQSQTSSVNRQSADSSGTEESISIGSGGNTKQRRKTSKFHRVRLGDGSIAALLDVTRTDASPELTEETAANVPSDSVPVRGVWRNGGGQRLVAKTQRDVTK